MTYQVVRVPTDQVEFLWPLVGGYIAKAVERTDGECNLEGTYLELLSGEQDLYVVGKENKLVAAGTFQIRHYQLKKVAYIVLAGGDDMQKWYKDALQEIERYAKLYQAKSIRIIGRRGWVRQLADEGFREVATIVGKNLED